MTLNDRQLRVQAWAASVTLHGIAVTLAVLLVSQIKPLSVEEPFHWNVSLVETLQEQSVEPKVRAARLPAPQPQVHPMQPVTTTAREVVQEVQTRQPNPFVAVEQPQPLEAPKAIERLPLQAMARASVVQQQSIVNRTLPSVKEVVPVLESGRMEQLPETVTQSVVPAKRPSAVYVMDSEPALHSAIAVGAPMAQSRETVVTRQVASTVIASSPFERTEPVVVEAPRDTQLSQVAAVPRESMAPPKSAEPAQPITKGVQQAPATRVDYGWLIESIGNRLAELKHYPEAARSNGLEGKVLLRAVVRADGQLAEVQVQKSSGHEELDTAAMETMRDASPLRLRHELGRPQIVITVPLVYSLAQ